MKIRPSVMLWLGKLMTGLPRQARDILRTSFFGIGGGLIAVAFQSAITWMHNDVWVPLSHLDFPTFCWSSFLLVVVSSLLSGLLVYRVCPAAAGSGIPQLKVAFWKDDGCVPFRLIWVKFLAGVLSIGGGASLGREGPTVQITAVLASNIAAVTGVARQGRRPAMSAGAAAGLASAFNTPMSAITFVLEEVIGDLNSTRYLSQTLLAAVLATFVTHLLVGRAPAFVIPQITDFSPDIYLLAPVVAGLAGAVGGLFQRSALDWRARIRERSPVPEWLRPTMGGLLNWVLGVTVFFFFRRLAIFGLGYTDLADMLMDRVAWPVCVVLLAAKFLGTITCYAWGGCGGIFAPTLFLGAATGLAASGLLQLVHPLQAGDNLLLAVVGMSACLGAVVRAPITSILIVFEMTHEFSFVPVLLLGTIVSQAVGRLMNKDNFYADVLIRDGIKLEKFIPPRTLHEWQIQEVSKVANFSPVIVHGLDRENVSRALKTRHSVYPLVGEGSRPGAVLGVDLLRFMETGSLPAVHPLETIYPDQTIQEARQKMLQSSTTILGLIQREGNSLLGILTLHDLLHAETRAIELDRD